jgi:hypothetical protein
MPVRTALLLAVTLAFLGGAGCGAQEGGACSGDVFHCAAQDRILECREGRWVGIPCRGPDGCRAIPGGLACDISGNQEGDGCPTPLEGTGFCRGTSPQSMFSCHAQQVSKLQDCQSCVTTSTSIVCTP